MEADPIKAQVRKLTLALYLSGAISVVAGVALGLAVSPVLFAIAAVAVVDFAFARMYATGVIGPLAERRRAEASGDAATIAEGDPSYNPYARED